MQAEKPSSTAEGAAILRALHQKLDDDPKILTDPIAMRLIEPDGEAYKKTVAALELLPRDIYSALRASFATRSRYAEDCLVESFRDGLRQFVILGAGLETFAYRQPPWAAALRILEVDHPISQQWKCERLAAANICVPSNLSMAGIDFEKVSLRDGLSKGGLDLTDKAVFSMLGVSQYLSENALDSTLKVVLSLPRSSEVVLSFVLPEHVLPEDERPIAAAMANQAASAGEPWRTRFLPEHLVAKLVKMGFSKVSHFSAEAAYHCYLQKRRDGLGIWMLEQMIRAIV